MPKCRVIESGICSITQPFHYAGEKGYDYYHSGMDLTDFNGSYNILGWLVAHTDGKVIAMRNDCTGFEYGSYGNYVLLQHDNGYQTLYAHASYNTAQVYVGQRVAKGQRLAYMGNTGTSYGGHLHWEVRNTNGTAIDPEPYLNASLPGMGRWIKYINGAWWCTVDGNIDYSYNGVAQNENGWWKCKNGKVDFNFTGLAENEYGWWMCVNGKVDFKYNGVEQNQYGWWKVTNGKVDRSFTGLAYNKNGWWYCKNGKVDFEYNGIVHNENGWWKVVNGKVDFSYNGLAENENGWWTLQGGKVDFNYNGLCVNENGIWVIKNGKVDFDYNGDYTFSGKTYKVKNGKVV